MPLQGLGTTATIEGADWLTYSEQGRVGIISGTPTSSGIYNVTVTVNYKGNDVGTSEFYIVVWDTSPDNTTTIEANEEFQKMVPLQGLGTTATIEGADWLTYSEQGKAGIITGTTTETGTYNAKIIVYYSGFPVYALYERIVVEESSIPVTSISISGSSSGEVGDTITLTATTSPSSADDRGVTFSITSGSTRATITSQSETSTGGRCTIELESAGSITVTATASDGSGVTRTKTITITEPEILVTSVSISGGSTVQVGSTLTLTATTSPSSADDRTVKWSITSGSNFVSYTTSDTSTGGRIVLTGLSAGTVTVRATAADGSGEYATKTITVQAADVNITSSQSDKTISTGTAFSYAVDTNVSGCTISVSGADWLQVSGNTVYGTPTEAGVFDITITASRSGYTSDTQSFTITVVSSLSFTSVPTTGLIIVEV